MTAVFQKSKQSLVIIGIVSILLILFLFSFTGTPLLLHLAGLSKINGTIFFETRSFYWLCLVLLWWFAIKIEDQKLLIWQEKKYKISTYVISAITIFFVLFVGGFFIEMLLKFTGLSKESSRLAEMIVIFRSNTTLLVFTCITAGVVEELIFRGYLLPRLTIIFKSPIAGIIVSSILFGLLHFTFGTLLQVIGPTFIGLVFAYYYYKYRNIKVLIFCHFLWDLVALLIKTHG